MDVPDECFISKVVQPVKVVDVRASSQMTPGGEEARQLHNFTTLEELNDFFNQPNNDQFSCRYMYAIFKLSFMC